MKMNNLTKVLTNVNRSIDIAIHVNGRAVGGQQNAILSQQRSAIDITNKINPEWSESLSGTRTWSIRCNGLYVAGSNALAELQNAFLNDLDLTAVINIDGTQYQGKVLITDFPLNVVYNSGLKYNITLLGTGPLSPVEQS